MSPNDHSDFDESGYQPAGGLGRELNDAYARPVDPETMLTTVQRRVDERMRRRRVAVGVISLALVAGVGGVVAAAWDRQGPTLRVVDGITSTASSTAVDTDATSTPSSTTLGPSGVASTVPSSRQTAWTKPAGTDPSVPSSLPSDTSMPAASSTGPSAGPSTTGSGTPQPTASVSVSTTAVPRPGVSTSPGLALTWTVSFVASDDVLNLRQRPDPSSPVIAALPPGTSGNTQVGEKVAVGSQSWMQIRTAQGVIGWVNARYLIAQPTDPTVIDWDSLQQITSEAGRWVLTAGGSGSPGWLSDRGLWVGGLLVYGDAPNEFSRVPASALQTHAAWIDPRTFPPPEDATTCGSSCTKSMVEALGLDQLGPRFSVVPHAIADAQGSADFAYSYGRLDRVRGIASVTIDRPADGAYNNWRRIHFFFDWSTGEPKVIAIYSWGWTP